MKEEEPVIITNEEEKKDELQAVVTLNDVMGDAQEEGGTMRIKGAVGHKMLHILLDTGSRTTLLVTNLVKW